MKRSWELKEDGFYLYTPYLFNGLYNFLSNNDYGLKISHLGDGYSSTIKEPRIVVSNYDFWAPVKGRFLYIKNDEHIWSPTFYPVKNTLDNYLCKHSIGYTEFISIKNQVKVKQIIFLPEKGSYEIMYIIIENISNTEKEMRIFTLAEFLLYESYEVDPIYYSWFTDTEIKKNTILYYRRDENPTIGFYKSLTDIDGYDSSLKFFIGDGDIHLPEVVKNGESRLSQGGGDPYIGSFQFNIKLAPGEKRELAIFMGVGKNTLIKVNKKYHSIIDIKNEFEKIKNKWQNKIYKKELDKLEKNLFGNYVKTFFPYQIYQQSEGLVRGVYRGFRDVAQDAIGLSYFNKKGAREIIITMCSKQFYSGRCLRQWNTSGGFNDERDFKDLPIWISASLYFYLKNTRDKSILDEKVSYFNSQKEGTIYEHMIRGIKYSLKYGKHSLLKTGEGDWNDSLNGFGKNGGSVWLSEFAYWGLTLIEYINEKYNYSCDINIEKEKKKLYKGVLKYWTGKWFARGITEQGNIIGGKDRIFLLPQAWFVISGMYKLDKEKAMIAIKNMIKYLDNENGLLVCYPAFKKYDRNVGGLSTLSPGVAENYAVYNHASTFAIFALYELGLYDEAEKYLKKLLPIYKNLEVTKREPYVFVNYYNGGYYPEKKGIGGIPWLTSTVSWFAIILFEKILKER